MGFSDVYFSLEDGWYKLVDKLNLHWLTDKIDKVLPSMVFFFIVFLALIVLIAIFVIPSYQLVKINFVVDGLPIEQDFNFVVNVDGGKAYIGNAVQGVAQLKLPKGDNLEFSEFSLTKFKPSETSLAYSEVVNVPMLRIYSNRPISIYFYLNDTPFSGNAAATLSCSDAILPGAAGSQTASGNLLEVDVPENCGTLTVSSSSDGLKPNTTECTSTTCTVYFEDAASVTDTGRVSYSTGSLKVNVLDDRDVVISNAEISIYDIKNLQTPVDVKVSNEVGLRQFDSLVVGSYKVYVIKEGFLTSSFDAIVNDNKVTTLDAKLSLQNLGKVFFKFQTPEKLSVAGEFILRDSDKVIVHRGTVDANGLVLVPVYSYDKKYYFDFAPIDTNYVPISVQEVTFKTSGEVYNYPIYTRTIFRQALVTIKVVDQDGKAVKNAKTFVKDNVSQFELLAIKVPDTNSDGYTQILLSEGIYTFRSYSGVTEGMSETVPVLPVEAGELPKYNATVTLYYGYNIFSLQVNDEFGLPLGYSTVKYYTKYDSKNDSVGKVLGPNGLLTDSFKAGQYRYFKVTADGYLPFTSEARFVLSNEKWDANVSLMQEQEGNPKVEFLGAYESLGGERVYNIEIGQAYYVGYDIYLYDKPEKFFAFELNAGNETTVEKEKFYIVDYYNSSDKDSSYSDENKESSTETDKKIVYSKWNKPSKGIYRVFYKIQIKNDSSVHMYDPLDLTWKLYIDDDDLVTRQQMDVLLIGGKSVCESNSFCSRVTVLDLKEKLYVDATGLNSYLLHANKDYEIEFDLINGLDGPDAELNNGYLQIYNAMSDNEVYETVKNNTSLRSFLKLTRLELDGPRNNLENQQTQANYNYVVNYNDLANNSKELYALFKPNILDPNPYDFVNFTKNLYIHGKMTVMPISKESSYINFAVIDSDRKVIVRGKPAISLKMLTSQAKDIKVEIFPDSLLIPAISQEAEVYVTDDAGNYVSDATVTFKMKHINDLSYNIYSLCNNLKTNVEGKAICRISGQDASLGTYFQVQVEKEGYNAYYHKDFAPDLKVAKELLSTDPNTIATNLLYPVSNEALEDLTIINNSSVNLTIDHVDLQFDRYSEPFLNILDADAMRTYLLTSNRDQRVIGRERGKAGRAETPFKDFFKAKINRTAISDIDEPIEISGLIKIHFKTSLENTMVHDVPFKISIVADGFPTNSDDCLKASFDDETFSSDGAKTLALPFNFVDNCVIATNDGVYPVVLKDVYAVVDVKSGSLGLGQFTGMVIQPVATTADSFVLGIPKSVASNLETDLYMPEHIGTLGFAPTGRKGVTQYSLKFIGYVKTSSGMKRVESKPAAFNVNVLNIEDCIKIYDDTGKETTMLTYSVMSESATVDALYNGNMKEITIRNVCENVPIFNLRLCVDNEGKRSSACGTLVGDIPAGIDFENRDVYSVEGVDLEKELVVKVKRPNVPGAYAIDVWLKLPDQFTFKKITDLKTNVKTSITSGLFAENPFLEVEEVNTKNSVGGNTSVKKKSEAVYIYNANLGDTSLHSIMNKEIYKKILATPCAADGQNVCFDTLDGLVGRDKIQDFQAAEAVINLGVGAALTVTSFIGTTATALGTGTAVVEGVGNVAQAGAGLSAGVGIALIVVQIALMIIESQVETNESAIAYTAAGAAAGVAGAVIVGMMIAGASACATGIGCILSAAALLIAAATWLLTAGLMGGLQQNDNTLFLLPLQQDNLLRAVQFNSDINLDVRGVFQYTGEDKYILISNQKYVKAYTTMLPNSWDGELTFRSQCPAGYEIVKNGIIPLDKADGLGIEMNYCNWGNPNPEFITGSDNTVGFKVSCTAPSYKKLTFKSYVLVPCKPKDYLWGRMQTKGVDAGYANTGLLKVFFENVSFDNFYGYGKPCNEEWCYKVININETPDARAIFGDVEDHVRIAYHNKKEQAPEVLNAGTPCTDAVGNVIGFTGEGAKPKVNYNWVYNDVDENFCSPDFNADTNQLNVKNYCDSSQFFTSNLKRIQNATTEIQTIQPTGCAGLPPRNQMKKNVTILSGDTNILGYDDPTIGFNDTKTKVQLIIPLKEMVLPLGTDVIVKMSGAETTSNRQFGPFDCNKVIRATDTLANRYELGILCIADIADFDPSNMQDPIIEDRNIRMYKGTVMVDIIIDSVPHRLTLAVDSEIKQFRKTCILTRPSTESVGGRMKLYQFVDTNITGMEDKLFEIQNILHYQVYLMDDGFSKDFLKDYFTACNEQFLSCPATVSTRYGNFVNTNRFAVVNMYDGSTKTNGPGLYNVHNIIMYPSVETGGSLTLDSNETTIVTLLEKVKAPEQDSSFYYMPLDGRVGITNDVVDRQGYGSDFSGDIATLYSKGGRDTLVSGLSTTSNALRTLQIDTVYDFGKVNKYKRGVVFDAKQNSGNTIAISFIPRLKIEQRTFTLNNIKPDTDTKFTYRLFYNGQPISNTLITYPWFVKDVNSIDFTGQRLADNYPKVSMLASSSDGIADYQYYAKLNYDSKQVTSIQKYDIFTFVYLRENENIDIRATGKNLQSLNETSDAFETDNVNVNSVSDVLEGIANKKLCIGGNSDNTFVFVNEYYFKAERS